MPIPWQLGKSYADLKQRSHWCEVRSSQWRPDDSDREINLRLPAFIGRGPINPWEKKKKMSLSASDLIDIVNARQRVRVFRIFYLQIAHALFYCNLTIKLCISDLNYITYSSGHSHHEAPSCWCDIHPSLLFQGISGQTSMDCNRSGRKRLNKHTLTKMALS